MDPRIDELLAQLESGELSADEYQRRLKQILDDAGEQARQQNGEQGKIERIAVAARKAVAL